MLIEQLQEFVIYGIVDKKSYPGYTLKVGHSLTLRGQKMLQAITIMQHIVEEDKNIDI